MTSDDVHASDMQRQSPGAAGLERLDAFLDDDLQSDDAVDDASLGRRRLFDGLDALRSGDVAGAVELFRDARRRASAPIDCIARTAEAECHRLSGRLEAAVRAWRALTEAESTPPAVRTMAWLSLAAVADDRGDLALATEARDALRTETDSSSLLSPPR